MILRAFLLLGMLPFFLSGCLQLEGILEDFLGNLGQGEMPKSVYLSLEFSDKGQLPLAPHVVEAKARPTMAMLESSAGVPLKFRILDKRTLKVHELEVAVGQHGAAPWGGSIQPQAFLSDLVVREGRAVHGPEGHVNPVVWVALFDEKERPLHQGWVFVRDTAQTAWDHPRFDLTFLGMVKKVKRTLPRQPPREPSAKPLRRRGRASRG